jgi:hypothetical protein
MSLDPGSEDDRKIAVEFGVYWMNVLKHSLASQDDLVGLNFLFHFKPLTEFITVNFRSPLAQISGAR